MTHAILATIQNHSPGWVFSASNFLDSAPRNTIDQTLHRLTKAGHIAKLSTGLFYTPQTHPILGQVQPSIDNITQAYANKFGYKIQVHPAKAANLLGLSQQVPTHHIYLTDGPNRSLVLGGMPITLKRVCPKKLLGIGTKSGIILQALYYFGAKGLDPSTLDKIKMLLDDKDRINLHSWSRFMPLWMQKTLRNHLLND